MDGERRSSRAGAAAVDRRHALRLCESSNEQAIENAQRFVKEAGQAVAGARRPSVDRARAIVRPGSR